MPRVPTYERAVTTETMPNVRVQSSTDASSFGGGVAKELGQFGSILEQRSNQMQDENDRNAVIEAKSNLDSQLTTHLYDENKGLLTRRGKDALGITDQFNKDYDTVIQESSKGLATKRQQTAFNQYAMGQKDSYLRSVSSHQAKERQSYTESNAKVAITNAQNLAIANPSDENTYKVAVDTITKTAKSVYGYMGDDVVNKMVFDGVSGIRIEQINSMLSQGQSIVARDFAVAHRAEIDPQKYDTVFAKAESKAISQESLAVADDVFNRFGVKGEQEGLKYLRETYGKNAGYDSFSRAVQARFVDERRFKNDAEKQNEESILGSIWKAGSLSEAQGIINNSGLSPGKQLYLLNQAKSKFKVLANKPTPDQTYWHNYERTGLTADLENMRLYEKRTQDGDPTPEQQKTANVSAARLNSYWKFSSGGSYNPGANTVKQKETIPLEEYDHLKSQGFTDEQISEKYLTDGVR